VSLSILLSLVHLLILGKLIIMGEEVQIFCLIIFNEIGLEVSNRTFI
jgi:hypothetical protein